VFGRATITLGIGPHSSDIWISATAKNFVHSKAHMLIAPNSSGFVTKHENSTLKEVLFQFLATIDRKM